MFVSAALTLLSLGAGVHAQQVGTYTTETHPSLTIEICTSSGCTTETDQIVLDANWRWLHETDGYTNCYTGNTWNTDICSSVDTCTADCALDGADYSGTYGITTSGNALTLKFVTGSNVGSRTYLMNSETTYKEFKLLNNEFTFDVDVSQLPCGLNGALYFVPMDADGGTSKYSTNVAGAKYGTGYCDAQCPRDLKFIDGTVSHRAVSISLSIRTDRFQLGQCRGMDARYQQCQHRQGRSRILLSRNGCLGSQQDGYRVYSPRLFSNNSDGVHRRRVHPQHGLLRW